MHMSIPKMKTEHYEGKLEITLHPSGDDLVPSLILMTLTKGNTQGQPPLCSMTSPVAEGILY